MRAIFLFLLLLLSSCGVYPTNEYPQDLPSRATLERSMRSTVALLGEADNGDPIIKCSGVFVADRTILTAAHCVATEIRMNTPFGELIIPSDVDPVGQVHQIVTYSDYQRTLLRRPINFRTILYDKEVDLALLYHDDTLSYDATIARFSNRRAEVGVKLFTVGHPVGIAYTLTSGYISSRLSYEAGAYRLYSNVPIFRGNSGGAMFDMQGQVIGIVSQMAGTAHLNRAIHIRTVRKFMSRTRSSQNV